MHENKKEAILLRKNGFAYTAIQNKLRIPKSTLSNWFSKLQWSKTIKRDLTKKAFLKTYPQLQAMSKARSRMWEEWREKARIEGQREFKNFSKNPLFIAGVMIYWGEG
ncbi:MAG: hypothetical protein AAB796_01040, partial [Patescibacteria group bacterium]